MVSTRRTRRSSSTSAVSAGGKQAGRGKRKRSSGVDEDGAENEVLEQTPQLAQVDSVSLEDGGFDSSEDDGDDSDGESDGGFTPEHMQMLAEGGDGAGSLSESAGDGGSDSNREGRRVAKRQRRTTADGTDAFASVMSKLLAADVDDSVPAPILAKNRSAERKLEQEREAERAARLLRQHRRMQAERWHVTSGFSTYEYEKKLTKIATKGVVKLFNAVRKMQSDDGARAASSVSSVAGSRPRSLQDLERETELARSRFLSLLDADQSAAPGPAGPAAAPASASTAPAAGKAGAARPAWKVLDDELYTRGGNKMKSWDQASSGDEAEHAG